MRLSVLNEDKTTFSYDVIAKRMWNDLVKKEQDECGVLFDLENDDNIGEIKTISIDQDELEHSDCKFKCQLWAAGGDWENPVYYFRCQLVDGYADGVSKYGDSHFCVIPSKNDGNHHLVKGDDDKFHSPDSDEKPDPGPNEKDCWDYLNSVLDEKVKTEINSVNESKTVEPDDETQIDKLTDEVDDNTNVAKYGRKCNYTRKNAWGYDDIRGGN